MTINFRTFDTGVRISPGLNSDPLSGKIGDIYWNIPNNNLRICLSVSPLIWYDLFIKPGTTDNSTIYWNSSSNSWKENVNLLIENSKIYSPDSLTTSTDLTLQAGNTAGMNENGGILYLKGGESVNGEPGAILVDGKYFKLPSNSYLEVDEVGSLKWLSETSKIGPYISDGVEYNRLDSADVNGEITGFANLEDSSISFNDVSKIVTLLVPTFSDFYIKGQRVRLTNNLNIVLPNQTTTFYVYLDVHGELHQTSVYDAKTVTSDNAFVCIIYCYSDNSGQPTVIDTRNLLTIDWANREYNRQAWGSAPKGFDITLLNLSPDGTSPTDYQFNISSGSLRNPDRIYEIPSFEVSLNEISTANFLNSDLYILNSPNALPVILPSGVPQWNKLETGMWSLESVADGYYYNYWIIGVHSKENQIVSLAGQNQHQNPYEAFSETWESVVIPGFNKFEMEPLYRVTFQYRSSYTNDAKSVIILAQSLLDPNSSLFGLASLPGLINQNQNTILSGGGTITHLGNILSWDSTASINIPGVAQNRNTIPANSVTLDSEGDVAYVIINRSGPGPSNLPVLTGNISSLSFTGPGSDLIYVIASRFNGSFYFGNKKALTEINLIDSTEAEFLVLPNLNSSLKIIYSLQRNLWSETGVILIAGGPVPSISITSSSSTDLGITFAVEVFGTNLLIKYSSSSSGYDGVMKFMYDSWTF